MKKFISNLTKKYSTKKDMPEGLLVSTSPQIKSKGSTARIMWTVFAVLLLPSIWGVIVFGLSALLILLTSIATALLAEYIINLKTKKLTITDGSAAVTGLLVGMNMPPAMPLHIPILSTLFAILIVKWTFGGLGKNWANPAIAGRVFAFLSYSKEMTTWEAPRFPWTEYQFVVDSTTTATPLSYIKNGEIFPYSISPLTDAFLGLTSGSIGEISALLLIVAAAILFIRKIITWEIPLSFIASFSLLAFLFASSLRPELFQGEEGSFLFINFKNILLELCTGGFLLAAFFMATDMVTSPATRMGMIIFGFGCGFLTFMVRYLGNFPEGVSLAILFMNILTPLLDRYIQPKKFGALKKINRKKEV